MNELIVARGITKDYGRLRALEDVRVTVPKGKIIGLVGPNGAGKTTLLKCILGLVRFSGELSVLGLDPHRHRTRLMETISYIADVAVIPGWIKVSQLLEYVESVHPRFRREKAQEFLSRTEIRMKSRVSKLSKGMKTQLHLALVMAIDASLLVLDEPTLGLDILYRKQFYTSLLNEYFDEERAILVSTHQVEEIEHILSDLLFIRGGRIVLDMPMEELGRRFCEVRTDAGRAEQARAMGPLSEQELFGQHHFLFEGADQERLRELGELRTPGVADLFVAKMGGTAS